MEKQNMVWDYGDHKSDGPTFYGWAILFWAVSPVSWSLSGTIQPDLSYLLIIHEE